MKVWTIGYEGATLAEVIETLDAARIACVIDVRALPLSRRPGFSKTPLSLALKEVGVAYLHLRSLGTPPAGRAAARAHDRATLERVYAGQLERPEAAAAVLELRERVAAAPSALLCFCGAPEYCHRSLLVAHALPEAETVHLAPTPGFSARR